MLELQKECLWEYFFIAGVWLQQTDAGKTDKYNSNITFHYIFETVWPEVT